MKKTGLKKYRISYFGTWWAAFIVPFILGGLFYVFNFGLYTLDFNNVNWLLLSIDNPQSIGGDLKQHYTGWLFFRESGWDFPLGTIQQLAYPTGLAITYTDSIPLLAIPIKLFSGIIPDNFQYFGLWGLISYSLTGGLAGLIVRKFNRNVFVIVLGASFFILSPIVFERMFIHTALAAHWIILLCIALILYKHKIATLKKFILAWSSVMILSVLVHPYFIPMVIAFFATALILDYDNIKKSALKAVLPLFSGLFVFWAIGGLSIRGVNSGGLGEYAHNINTPINPLGWSNYLQDLPLHTKSGETMAYLGMGIIALLPVALYIAFMNIERIINWAKQTYNNRLLIVKYSLLALIILGLYLFALSPIIQFNQYGINIPTPNILEEIWSIFRATARIYWALYYVLITVVLAIIIFGFKGSKKGYLLPIFLSVFLFIQFVDVAYSNAAINKRNKLARVETVAIQEPQKEIAALAKGKQHIVWIDAGLTTADAYMLLDIALAYNMTVNDGYFARSPRQDIDNGKANAIRQLQLGTLDVNTLYITKDVRLAEGSNRTIIKINDNYFIIKKI
jgi:hypothetical protein